ncbi:MAG: peptidase M22 [Eubacteriales bacterium]|nr:peptidase M22 [Eubacteriales bacterium]
MILGIDTSNYTTSCALSDGSSVLSDKRRMLQVPEKMKGLRQSEAFFQHVSNLPELIGECVGDRDIDAVAVSLTPRRVEGSYMPCFTAGVQTARSIAAVLHVPVIGTTHQEGHIRAALIGSDIVDTDPFICVHLSGGTTEILSCRRDERGYAAEIVGRTIDISAGQLIDRLGVLTGLPFPCGKAMDEAYRPGGKKVLRPSVKGSLMSFSGIETRAAGMYEKGELDEVTLYSAIFDVIAESLVRAVSAASKETGIGTVLFAGGVSSSENIASLISSGLPGSIRCRFSDRRYASDNAAGVALIGNERLENDAV